MLRIALRVRLRASPFAQDDNEGVGVGAFDDPFVGALAAHPYIRHPLDDPH